MNTDAVPSVLFVCMGNICRSPAGEGLFCAHLEENGLEDSVHVDSAGTIAYHTGNPPDPRMRRAAERRGYVLGGAARQVRENDLSEFDLVVAMDRENLADLQRLADRAGGGHDRLRLLTDFTTDSQPIDVPDPYYGGDQGFETVLDMIESACPALLDTLLDGAR
ncbi:MAG: low molecular weight phosphotyrosine protein phosphatase [Thermoanaerobaculia bacterium]|nr:low molecular weight phosphotyrosine protein phosphatase [Thermoanaerobaculia bacterium]